MRDVCVTTWLISALCRGCGKSATSESGRPSRAAIHSRPVVYLKSAALRPTYWLPRHGTFLTRQLITNTIHSRLPAPGESGGWGQWPHRHVENAFRIVTCELYVFWVTQGLVWVSHNYRTLIIALRCTARLYFATATTMIRPQTCKLWQNYGLLITHVNFL